MFTFELYCPQHYTEIQNYELAKAENFKGWICHHIKGENYSRNWLLLNNMYYNRQDPSEFKFVTVKEHRLIHTTGRNNPMYGRKHTDESKDLMSINKTGVTLKPFTEEHKHKLSESQKGRKLTDEHRNKLSTAWNKRRATVVGTHWYNNGEISLRAVECPEGFVKGKLNRRK